MVMYLFKAHSTKWTIEGGDRKFSSYTHRKSNSIHSLNPSCKRELFHHRHHRHRTYCKGKRSSIVFFSTLRSDWDVSFSFASNEMNIDERREGKAGIFFTQTSRKEKRKRKREKNTQLRAIEPPWRYVHWPVIVKLVHCPSLTLDVRWCKGCYE